MNTLTQEEVTEFLENMENWSIKEEKWLERKYRFKDYLKGISFINKIAYLSEEVNHHPLIKIDYKLVTLRLSSWQAKGVTNMDIQLAKRYDEIYQKEIDSI